jgi:hypothetical protein
MLFNRYTQVQIKDRETQSEITLNSNQVTIYFDVKHEDVDAGAGRICTLYIYNLAQATKDKITAAKYNPADSYQIVADDETVESFPEAYEPEGGSDVLVDSGYVDHHGAVFMGVVTEKYDTISDGDVCTVLRCRSFDFLTMHTRINNSYEAGKNLIEIVEEMLNLAGVPVGKLDSSDAATDTPRVYANDKTVDVHLRDLAAELKMDYRIVHGAAYYTDISNPEETIYVLNSDTGLLKADLFDGREFFNATYRVTCLLLPDIVQGRLVEVNGVMCLTMSRVNHTSNNLLHITEADMMIGANGVYSSSACTKGELLNVAYAKP